MRLQGSIQGAGKMLRNEREHFRTRRFCYGASEASFETKASESCPAGLGNGRCILVADGRCIRGNYRAGHGYSAAGHRTTNRFQRGRAGRRQLVDVLCLRQGKSSNAAGRRTGSQGLRRLPGLQRLPRLPVRQRLWLRRLQLRLLLVVGILPPLLGSSSFRLH